MKSLKRIFCLIMIAALLCSIGPVASAEERSLMDKTPYADALYRLGLFLGTDQGYELDAGLTREQAITLVVRFMGAEEKALAANYPHPFTDVSSWASPYVGYAYVNRITRGIGATSFGALDPVTEPQFMTFLLRLLGYVEGTDFTWDAPYDLAEEVGLVPDSLPQSTDFTRGCAVVQCWRLLTVETVNGGTLAQRLMDDGVFTSADWSAARKAVSNDDDSSEDNSNGAGFVPEIEPPVTPGGTGSSGGSSGDTSGGTSGGTSGDTSGGTSGDTSGGTSGDTSGGTSGDTSGGASGDSGSTQTGNPNENETEDVVLP